MEVDHIMKSMKSRRISFFIILTICFSIVTTGAFAMEQTLPSGVADSEIGNIIDNYIEEHKDTTAGVSIAVFRGEETLYKTGYGLANIKKQLSVNDDTVYEWGSVSKLLVWVSAMQLWEQGKIDLDNDVQQYLPEGFFTKLACICFLRTSFRCILPQYCYCDNCIIH